MNLLLIALIIIIIVVAIFFLFKTIIKVFFVLAVVFLLVLSAIYFVSYKDEMSFKDFFSTELNKFVGNEDDSLISSFATAINQNLNETKELSSKKILNP